MQPAPSLQHSSVVRASAGTGKTFNLTNLFLTLIIKGERADRILASTFTVKAAGEIRDRIFQRLCQATLDNSGCTKLSSELDLSFTPSELRSVFTNLVKIQNRLAIQTLDAFAISIAKTFSGELGLPPNWSIITPDLFKQLRIEMVQRVVEGLRFEQIDELLQGLKSGERDQRVSDYLLSQVDRIDALFKITDHHNYLGQCWLWASEELSEIPDLRSILDRLSAIPLPQTKDGKPNLNWKNSVERDLARLADRDISSIAEDGILKSLLNGNSKFARIEIPESFLTIYREIEELVINAEKIRIARKNRATRSLYEAFGAEIRERASKQHLTFDQVKGIISQSIEKLSFSDLYFRLDTSYRHLLLDEFQDTSLSEWQIISPLIEEIFSQIDEQRTFFCVGDTKQAIYGWRGGKAEIFGEIEKIPALGKPLVRSLDQSYRSSQAVIDFVNTIFTALPESEELADFPEVKDFWRSDFRRHSTTRSDHKGAVVIRRLPADPDGYHSKSLIECAEATKAILAANPHAEIAILVRRNSLVGEVIQLLSEPPFNISASQEGGTTLTSSAAISPLLALCRVADSPGDTLAFHHLSISPLASHLKIPLLTDTAQSREAFSQKLRDELFKFGYGPTLTKHLELFRSTLDSRSERRAQQLVELGFEYDLRRTLRSHDFLTLVEQTRVEDPSSSQVRVMTIHQSKGLEFDYVILPEIDYPLLSHREELLVFRDTPLGPPSVITWPTRSIFKGRFPEIDRALASSRTSKVVEELNLLYVALTRAKRSIVAISQEGVKGSQGISFSKILLSLGRDFVSESEINYRALVTSEGQDLPEAPQIVSLLATKQERVGPPVVEISKPSDDSSRSLKVELMAEAKRAARSRGIALHLLFQRLAWLDDLDSFEPEVVLQRAGYESVEALRYASEFSKLVSLDNTKRLFTPDYYEAPASLLMIEREVPVALLEQDELISGVVDRLVLTLSRDGIIQRAHIVDFKSDRAEDNLQVLVDKYSSQLSRYRAAVSSIYSLDLSQIKVSLAFVTHGEVIEVR